MISARVFRLRAPSRFPIALPAPCFLFSGRCVEEARCSRTEPGEPVLDADWLDLAALSLQIFHTSWLTPSPPPVRLETGNREDLCGPERVTFVEITQVRAPSPPRGGTVSPPSGNKALSVSLERRWLPLLGGGAPRVGGWGLRDRAWGFLLPPAQTRLRSVFIPRWCCCTCDPHLS